MVVLKGFCGNPVTSDTSYLMLVWGIGPGTIIHM